MRTPNGYKPSKIKKIISFIFLFFFAIGVVSSLFDPPPMQKKTYEEVK
tara:strand:- start:402 stop:545 length:144 start_codon:yes stop_codon:yes gene_type:complete